MVLLRIFIGWHFTYEGVVKLFNPSSTSKGYLLSADGFMNGFFHWLASDSMIFITDTLNIGALIFVGATLLLGFYERIGCYVGMLLLAFYYLAHPALPWLEQGPAEGNYWLINKNLIELTALWVLSKFTTAHFFGFAALSQSNVNVKSTAS